MNYNRKTFRFLKLEKSGDFARRKNDVEGKMLETKLKGMEKEERCIRQKIYQIRREKYSRTFYKSPERARSSKFVDINVCENDKNNQEENKSNQGSNLISASSVERTKSSLRRNSIVVEELHPGQVVRVCVSSKLGDKVTRDENTLPTSLSPVDKEKRRDRRHSVGIVTDIDRTRLAALFTTAQNYMQSISESDIGVAQESKDDLCVPCTSQEKYFESTFLSYISYGRFKGEQNLDNFSEKLSDITSKQDLTEEKSREDTSSCDKQQQKSFSGKKVSILENAEVTHLKPGTEKYDIGTNKPPGSPRGEGVASQSDTYCVISPVRPRSSRRYSDSCVQKIPAYRKCTTPRPILSKRHSFVEPSATGATGAIPHEAESIPNLPRFRAVGLKQRPGSLSDMPSVHSQGSALIAKEEKMRAEQVIIRQIEIQTAANKMRKLSLQHFGEPKNTQKARKQSSSSSPYMRQRSEYPSNDLNNPQVLRKFVQNQCKKEKGQNTIEQVLSGLSEDMPDCRYLRCDKVQ